MQEQTNGAGSTLQQSNFEAQAKPQNSVPGAGAQPKGGIGASNQQNQASSCPGNFTTSLTFKRLMELVGRRIHIEVAGLTLSLCGVLNYSWPAFEGRVFWLCIVREYEFTPNTRDVALVKFAEADVAHIDHTDGFGDGSVAAILLKARN